MSIENKWSYIEISGEEDLRSLYEWGRSNPSMVRSIAEDIVEAIKPIRLDRRAVFDTSKGLLIINHALSSRSRSSDRAGVWVCHNGQVHMKGESSESDDEWAPMDFESVQVLINKANGYQSFFNAQATGIPTSIKKVRYILTQGDVRAIIDPSRGEGVFEDVSVVNAGNGTAVLKLKDTDTIGIELDNVQLGGCDWGDRIRHRESFHKYLRLKNPMESDKYKLVIIERGEIWPVFYQPRSGYDDKPLTSIEYRNPDVWSGSGRACIVTAFNPKLVCHNGYKQKDVKVSIMRVETGDIEAYGTTDESGKVFIDPEDDDKAVYSMKWLSQEFYEPGTKYIKKHVTPAVNGAVESEDMGIFEISLRKPNKKFFSLLHEFDKDFSGERLLLPDPEYKNSFESLVNSRSLNTAQEVYDHYKLMMCEDEMMHVEPFLELRDGIELRTKKSVRLEPYQSRSIMVSGDLITIKSESLMANFVIDGILTMHPNSEVRGSVEDANGCLVKITKQYGGAFNLIARRADSNEFLDWVENGTEVNVRVPRGIDVKIAAWSVGHRVYSARISTANGGVDYEMAMKFNRYLDLDIDIRPFIVNTDVAFNFPTFSLLFNAPMSLNLEELKTLIHYLVGSRPALEASLPSTQGSQGLIEINKEEILVKLPFLTVERGPQLTKQDRVEINGFVNTSEAEAYNPNYVINPSDEDGLYVQMLKVKPTFDPILVSKVIRDEMSPTLNEMETRLLLGIKG